MTEAVAILTARLDPASFAWLNALRRAHFPPERNVLAAHLTMFHRLSPPQVARLQQVPLPAGPIPVSFDALLFLGGGNAIGAASPALLHLRELVKAAVGADISRQDAQRWRPHVTIQNKVAPAAARALHDALAQDFQARTGTVDALQVWDYLGGPWRLAQTFPFGASPM